MAHCKVPKCTLCPLSAGLVYAARLHAAGVGTHRAVPPRVTSYRIKPEQAAELNAFTARPEMTQTLASSGGKKGATTELRLKPAVLLCKYTEAVPKHLQVVSSAVACLMLTVCLPGAAAPTPPPYTPPSVSLPSLHKVGDSKVLEWFKQPCFKLMTSKSCLCGPCEEHGWQATCTCPVRKVAQ